MRIINLLTVLSKLNILSPIDLYKLLTAILKNGINPMMLLNFAMSKHGRKIALVDEEETLSYNDLMTQSEKLSILFHEKYQLKKGQKIGFLCRNTATYVKSIFAISRLGADIYLLNVEMSKSQFNRLVEQHDFDFLIYDAELSSFVDESIYKKEKLFTTHEKLPSINRFLTTNTKHEKIERSSSGNIVLQTGGTTKLSKDVVHKPSLFNFLQPLIALVSRLKLEQYHTAYIATPIYHGYGIAILFLFIALGKKIVLSKIFDARKACTIIHKHQVEVVTVVPLMISKMLKQSPDQLKSLKCIASGSAELNPTLVNEVQRKLGNILNNLYGTSEAGLNIVATPDDLNYSQQTIGRKIKGVHLKILNTDQKKVETSAIGQLYIKNNWSMKNRVDTWIETGDLCYTDQNGYYYLCGRTDDMIVSAGENVYPIELENVLIGHPLVEAVAVIGITDEIFGQRLKAFVQLRKQSNLTKESLIEWLRPQIARYQMPKDIEFIDNMPYTSIGKIDKKQLRISMNLGRTQK